MSRKQYSDPKIYSGGVDIKQWKDLDKAEKESALTKSWYVRWSFRNPETGNLERQKNIKAGANYYKKKSERMEILNSIAKALLELLQNGYNPYSNRRDFDEVMSVEKALDFALDIKRGELAKKSIWDYNSRINDFKKYLFANGFKNRFITSVTKNDVVDYLNTVFKRSGASNRNNTRASISVIFGVLYSNDIIPENFIAKIEILKHKPARNRTYSKELVNDLFEYMEENESELLLFIKFVSYNFLRPVEVCRLRVKDIDTKNKSLRVFVKQGKFKTKRIPDIVLSELPDLNTLNQDDYLFSPDYDYIENQRRDYFTKKFKKVKDKFGLGVDYGIYSFRHTFITKLYRSFRKTMTPFEAKSNLMFITGHATMVALEKYLRDIDGELSEDYSEHL